MCDCITMVNEALKPTGFSLCWSTAIPSEGGQAWTFIPIKTWKQGK